MPESAAWTDAILASPATLAAVAVFVDRFQCFEAVEVYADRWIRQLEGSLSAAATAHGRGDLAPWIYVAYVFRQPALFKAATRLAISHSSSALSGSGLPIREKIIRKKPTCLP